MSGLAEREIEGRAAGPTLLDRLIAAGPGQVALPRHPPDVRGYLTRALRGGFPDVALIGSDRARSSWLSSYIDQVVSRDVALVGVVRNPMRLRRYLQAIAARTGTVPTLQALIDTAGIDRSTAMAYDTMLESLFITERLPAWSTNRLSRLIRLPKRHLVDPAFLGPLLGVDARGAMRDGDLLGRILDSFVVAQLRADCAVSDLAPRLFHARDANGRHAVDIVAELADGRVIGIVVKAGAAPGAADARHLRWLRDAAGRRFAAGVILHTGARPFRFDETIFALPICALWG